MLADGQRAHICTRGVTLCAVCGAHRLQGNRICAHRLQLVRNLQDKLYEGVKRQTRSSGVGFMVACRSVRCEPHHHRTCSSSTLEPFQDPAGLWQPDCAEVQPSEAAIQPGSGAHQQ